MRNEDGFITYHLPYFIVAKKEHAVTKKPKFSHLLISYFIFHISYFSLQVLFGAIDTIVKISGNPELFLYLIGYLFDFFSFRSILKVEICRYPLTRSELSLGYIVT